MCCRECLSTTGTCPWHVVRPDAAAGCGKDQEGASAEPWPPAAVQVVIFVKAVSRAKALDKLLVECNFPSICIHGQLSQTERLEVRFPAECELTYEFFTPCFPDIKQSFWSPRGRVSGDKQAKLVNIAFFNPPYLRSLDLSSRQVWQRERHMAEAAEPAPPMHTVLLRLHIRSAMMTALGESELQHCNDSWYSRSTFGLLISSDSSFAPDRCSQSCDQRSESSPCLPSASELYMRESTAPPPEVLVMVGAGVQAI